jgi:hypothetical protein
MARRIKRGTLPVDATIASVIDGINAPVGYLRSVLHHMRGYRQDCQVRIKTNSSPAYPDYLVEELFYDDSVEHTGQPVLMELYQGRTHKAYPSSVEHNPYNSREWSTAAMNYREIQALIGELIGWR